MSAWIKMIKDEDASKALKHALSKAKTPHGTVDNVLRVHSLRPSTMEGQGGHKATFKATGTRDVCSGVHRQ